MTIIYEFLKSNVASDMSAALLHTLWQGLIITAILFLVLKSIAGKRSQLRYRLSIFSLLVILLCWLGTFSILQYEPVENTETLSVVTQVTSSNDIPATTNTIYTAEITETVRQPSNNTADTESASLGFGWFIVLWFAGVIVMLGRMFAALAGAAKLKRDAVDITDNALVELFEKLCEQMNITQKIRFAASQTLGHPGVIGFFRPVLLIPVSVLTEVSAEYIEAIIAHELAHIRRYDYLINFCQMIIEAIFFFNPAVWWISRRIRIEREACCDIAGVENTGRRIGYAQVLLKEFSRTAAQGKPAMTAAMTGFSDDNGSSSAERVKRIIHPQHKPCMKIGWVKLVLLLAVAGGALVGLWKTADITIAMAAKILTPAERVAEMSRINEEYSKQSGLYDPNDKVIVHCRFVTVDGNPLPVRTYNNCKGKESTSLDLQIQIRPYGENRKYIALKPDGTFGIETRLKRFYITAIPGKDYATNFYGPFKFEPGEVIDGLELPLETGFTANIKFVNENNEPVSGVDVTGGYPMPPDYGSWHHSLISKSADDGIAVLKNCSDELASFSCQVPGYVKEAKQKIRLSSDQPYVWQLTSTPLTKIQIVADVDGTPIGAAAVNLHGKEYWQISSYSMDKPGFTAGADGVVEMKSLDQTQNYLALVFAEGYQGQYVDIKGGDEIVIRLKEFVPVKGKITGDLSGLAKDEKGSYFQFCNDYTESESSTHSDCTGDNTVYVEMIDGEAHFQIDKYFGQRLDISLGSKSHNIKIDEDDLSNVVIDIPLLSSYEKRKIVFNFVNADGSGPLEINGKFKLNYKDDPRVHYTKKHLIDIVDGKAEVEIIMPNHIAWKPTPETGWYFYNEYKNIDTDYSGVETIKCYPAGAIFGKITNPSQEVSNAYVSIHTAKKSPLLDEKRHGNIRIDFEQNIDMGLDGAYYIAPVPLGGEYAITVGGGNLLWISDDIKLDEEKPLYELDIPLPAEFADITGRLLDPDGKPIAGIGFTFNKKARHGGGIHSNSAWATDIDGRFEFKGVNPDSSIKYSISFKADGFVKKIYDLKVTENNRIVLEEALSVTGTVLDKDTNQPVQGVTVKFWPKERTDWWTGFEVKTDSKGKFSAHQFADVDYHYILNKDGYGGVHSSDNLIHPSEDNDLELFIQKR